MSQEIKSWNNGIVEDQAGSTLPTVHAEDNGKVLQVVEGQWDKGGVLPEPELPAPSSENAGKIAKVVSDGEEGYIWSAEDETSELPAVTASDNQKVLGVKDGIWKKIPRSDLTTAFFVSWWGDSPTITGFTGDELFGLSQYADSIFMIGGYSGAEGSPTLKCVSVGGNGAPWIFEGFVDDASGMKLIVINLVPTGNPGSRTITATKKVYTLTADT